MPAGQTTNSLDLIKKDSGDVTCTNCYKTANLGEAGKFAYTVAGGTGFSVKLSAGSTVGVEYNNIVYAGSGETVTISVTADDGYTLSNVVFNNGEVEATYNDDGTYTITMPAGDVTVTAELERIIVLGDVNFDGSVDDKDAALVLKYISENKPFYPDNEDENANALKAADADGIGGIDMLDVIKILQISEENKIA